MGGRRRTHDFLPTRHPDSVHPRHYGPVVPTVCCHHRGFSSFVGLQRVDPQPCPCSHAAPPEEGIPWTFRGLLPLVQPGIFLPRLFPEWEPRGGFSFVLEDRSGGTTEFLAAQEQAFIAAANKRPELAGVMTTALLSVPQVGVTVDNAKVLTQTGGSGRRVPDLADFHGRGPGELLHSFRSPVAGICAGGRKLPDIGWQSGQVLCHQRYWTAGSAEHAHSGRSAGRSGIYHPIQPVSGGAN